MVLRHVRETFCLGVTGCLMFPGIGVRRRPELDRM